MELSGTLDPIHYGHMEMLDLARKKLKINDAMVMPANRNPYKEPTPLDMRVDMARLAYAQDENVKVLHRGNNEHKLPQNKEGIIPIRIVGADLIMHTAKSDKMKEYFGSWLENQTAVAGTRDHLVGFDDFMRQLEVLNKEFNIDWHVVKNSKDISSTIVRANVGNDAAMKDLIPPAVHDYIKEHDLYK